MAAQKSTAAVTLSRPQGQPDTHTLTLPQTKNLHVLLKFHLLSFNIYYEDPVYFPFTEYVVFIIQRACLLFTQRSIVHVQRRQPCQFLPLNLLCCMGRKGLRRWFLIVSSFLDANATNVLRSHLSFGPCSRQRIPSAGPVVLRFISKPPEFCWHIK